MPNKNSEAKKAYMKEYSKQYVEENRESVYARQKRWRLENKDHVNATKAAWRKSRADTEKAVNAAYREKNRDKLRVVSREWRRANPEKCRNWSLKRKFGITQTEFELLFEIQMGKCAICAEAPDEILNIDHDHITGEIRALLCSACNRGLGHFKDDLQRISAAAIYLALHKKA
jgi:hypothetical protein